MGAAQTAMLGGIPYTVLRDTIWTHRTAAEGLHGLFASPPSAPGPVQSVSSSSSDASREPGAVRQPQSTVTTRCNMNVWQCDDSRPVPGLVPAEVETPQPRRGEVLIRVHAVGVTGTELLWQPSTHTQSGENRRHAIPGHEFSGTIAAVGAGADGAVGEEVFGMNDW